MIAYAGGEDTYIYPAYICATTYHKMMRRRNTQQSVKRRLAMQSHSLDHAMPCHPSKLSFNRRRYHKLYDNELN